MEGSAAAERKSEALPKQKRLAKRSDFLRVYETGRKQFSRYSVLFFASNDLSHSRLGVTATKKLGKANVRNRLKRWTREVYRKRRAPLDLDSRRIDIVVNVKNSASDISYREFTEDLGRALQRVAESAA
ncbi:MAG: ribonuclease P protein component [Thermoanaerobaculia bacterium]